VKTENFDRRPNKSGRITEQGRKILLESGEEAEHIRCPKLNSPVYKTRLTGQIIMKKLRENLRS
jgi:hypothetical protein